ncbi:hypothetical protein [Nocardia asteroides]|uniref:hypothetical protein n=1 Tax=Nocardia asteroides TaxID=1824 RepID=UPI0033FD1694
MTRETFAERQRQRWEYDPHAKEIDLALGCMIHHAAQAEYEIYHVLGGLLDSPHSGRITGAMQASTVLQAIQQIAKDCDDYDDEATAEIVQLVSEAKEAFTKRNVYVHGMQFADRGDEKTLASKDRSRGAFRLVKFTAGDLYDLAEIFGRLCGGFCRWWEVHIAHEEPSKPGEIRARDFDVVPEE